MAAYLFDIIIVALLALFAWRGAAKGLILSLCGLAAIFVVYLGAQFLSERFCEPVGNILRPIVIQTVRGAGAEPEVDPEDPEDLYTMEELVASIQEKGLFEGLSAFLEQADSRDLPQGGLLSPLEALAGYLSTAIARALLFSLVFFGGLLAWFLLSHALDLAFKLPILAEINLAGGLIIGLVKGGLLTVVLVWLGQVIGLLPNPPDTPVLSMFTVDRLWELLGALPA
ncbi:MAG: CvpA family protein [Oscillospiraceae bacterium]|nr:CvpA family protein [Oscillospiraceae bacterium]MCI9549820.1 CvpA family protein [Oscillospiraceae bacterium]